MTLYILATVTAAMAFVALVWFTVYSLADDANSSHENCPN